MATKKPKFTVMNTEDITKKPEQVQMLWRLMSKMDPNGDLWTDNKAIIALDGQTAADAPDRTVGALKLAKDEAELVKGFGIVDGPEADNVATATGVIFTPYQMIEIAFALGVQFEAERLTKTMNDAATEDLEDESEGDDDDDDEEVFDDGLDEEAHEDEDDNDDDDDE